ncbi:MAG: hypothetical protein J6P84_01890 [Alphaproteobacteria bacterium]|nr:hypothetical protein [Alphaproteobacteria bacterium]MBO7536744.1 hypothetical protein [Alphaproteobacteria bacterium]
MQTENVLIARICHDLITPCNAINLGLEAYEMSEDKGLLSCIRDSASKANVILKFMRELFLSKEEEYMYPASFIQKLISEFLRIYNISCNFVTNNKDLPCSLGQVILYDSAIMKEIMPMGGKVMFNVSNDYINIVYSGDGIIQLDTFPPEELTYKNVLRFKLLEQLRDSGFSVNSSIEGGEGKIMEIRKA